MSKPATFFKLFACAALCCVTVLKGQAQKDSAATGADPEDIEALFADLSSLLDSITKPKSFASVSLMGGNRLLNVTSQNGQATITRSWMVSPSAAYYHKTGIGFSATALLLNRNGGLQPSQYLTTVSYDYLKLRGVLTGIAYTRFFRPDSLDYYTSPLKNEVSAYALYRKSWFKPSLSVSYGWGTNTEVTRQAFIIKAIREKRKRKRGESGTVDIPTEVVTTTSESVSDWLLSFSTRHDFYFFNVLSRSDHFRLTPQLSFTGGTQRYGFNQSTNAYVVKISDVVNKPFMSDQVSLQESTRFQPLSVTAFLRTAYSKGKFFIQPQVALDYYLPDTDDHFTTSFALNAGFIF